MKCTKSEMKEYIAEAFIGTNRINSELRHSSATQCVNGMNCEVDLSRSNVTVGTEIHHKLLWKLSPIRRVFTANGIVLGFDDKVFNYFNTHNELLKVIGETDSRIKADYLRILRYFRLTFMRYSAT